jgi:precorrin-6B C5,15-methyltransferase / cobalt-precorrin-6B C5,C15-methyltransferase
MKGRLTVIGCGTHVQDLTPFHFQVLDDADVLAGGRRLLDWFPDFQGKTLEIGKHVQETVAKLFKMAREQRVAVLASGDPLFFGIGARFVDAPPDIEVTILPNVSAAQQALARLALPWSETRFFSVHGRKSPLPWRRILAAATAVIYTDPERNPAIVAKELIASYPPAAERTAAVAENLGGSEHFFKGRLDEIAGREFSGLAVLVLLPPDTQGKVITPPLSFGEEDCHFAHQRGLITHPEVRAVVLSKLRLGPGVLWDLGAGSGSVAVEACGLCPDLSAHAVEKDPQRVEIIGENARRAGLTSCHVIEGNVLETMESLPAPRAVFVGGGGKDAGRIVEGAFAALRPGGRLVASAVLLGSKEQLQNRLEESRVEIVELEIRRAAPVGPGQMMKPDNPVTLYVFEKKIE